MQNDIDQDDNFEDFDFKPITEGLGFHHSIAEKSKIETKMKSQQKSLQDDFETRADSILSKFDKKENHVQHMGELSAFYKDDVVEENPVNIDEIPALVNSQDIEVEKEASFSLRFTAWFLDSIIIFAMLLLMISSVIIFADMPMEYFNFYMVSDEIFSSFGVIFLLFYTFYFSFLDRSEYSTIGKRMMGLKVISQKGLSIQKTFLRTIITLVSLLTLGLISLLSLQDSLTDTKVVKA